MSETIEYFISTKYVTYRSDDKMRIRAMKNSLLFGAFNAMCHRSMIPIDTCVLARLDEEKNIIEKIFSLEKDYNTNKITNGEVLYFLPIKKCKCLQV